MAAKDSSDLLSDRQGRRQDHDPHAKPSTTQSGLLWMNSTLMRCDDWSAGCLVQCFWHWHAMHQAVIFLRIPPLINWACSWHQCRVVSREGSLFELEHVCSGC